MRQFNSITIEQYNNKKGVTLIELLIAISIFALIVVGFSSIDTFSRYQVVSSDRRAKLQNDASYVLEHMAKEISNAIGDETNPPSSRPVDTSTIGGDTAIQVWIDYNPDGRRDSGDYEIAYRYRPGTAPASDRYQIWYCPQCTNAPCTACNPAWGSSNNILSKKITNFAPTYNSSNNYVEVQLIARWDPAQPTSLDNPEITLRNRISMPVVSTN